MGTRITSDVVESYLNCKVKAHLKLAGNQGVKSDYEGLLLKNRLEVRQQAISKLVTKTSQNEIAKDILLTASSLRAGRSYVLDPILDQGPWLLRFGGLKKVEGSSELGDFHYVPLLFHEAHGVGKAQKLLLELYGWLLSSIQGRHPAYGVVWHSQDCQETRVRLNPDTRRCERFWQDLIAMTSPTTPPCLILNDHCQICEFRQRCHDQAVQEDNLSLLRGMGEKEIKRNARKGIFTVTQLSYTFRPRRRPKWAKAAPRPHSFALQALALRENKIHINGTPELKTTSLRIYLDVEGLPAENFHYLIGVLIDHGTTQEFHSFWADSKDDRGCVVTQLVQLLSRFTDYTIYHYGNYESKALNSLKSFISDEFRQPLAEIQKRTVNVLSVVHASIYVPALSNTLKDIAGFLGFRWTDHGATGLRSIIWRKQWERTRDDELKTRLLRYNQEDCLALKMVTDFMLSCNRDGSPETIAGLPAHPDVVHTCDLQLTIARSHRFCVISFVLPELDFVNKCAYFDYQREKVFVRTNKEMRRVNRRKTTGRNGDLTPNSCTKLECRKCPSCGSRRIQEGKRSSRVIADLKFSITGVKRWIIRYDAHWYHCERCDEAFLPEHYPTDKGKYGHGMKAWFAYQNIIGGQEAIKIMRGVNEVFGLYVEASYRDYKPSLAEYYKGTYKGILAELLRGTLLHADETEVAISGMEQKGYVWVFANMQMVYLFYKDSRKGLFLEEMLQGFSGVVVSDFFTAYDTLHFPRSWAPR